MSYSLEKVNYISIIGDFNDWAGDVDLTYKKESGAWEANNVKIGKTGTLKFRMNHDWDISLGHANGDGNNFQNHTQNNTHQPHCRGWTYDFNIYISCEGKNHVVITKK